MVVENVGSGSPTPKRNTRRSPRYRRGCVRVYASMPPSCVCVYVYVVRIRRGGEAVHLAARRGRMESWRTAAGGYGVKAVGARLVEGGRRGEGGKMGVFGWPNPGGSGRRGGVGPRGGQGGSCRSPGQQTSSDPAGGSTRLN